MAERVSSKVIVREVPPAVRKLPAAPTARAAFVGVTERGPWGANLVTDFEGYRRLYGGYTQESDLALAVLGFFDNGGRELWISRIAHYSDITDPDSHLAVKGSGNLVTPGAATPGTATGSVVPPVAMSDGEQLGVDVDGGGEALATFNAAQAEVQTGTGEPYALADSQTLTVKIDNGTVQTITFLTADFVAIGAATAEEVVHAINKEILGAHAETTSGGTRFKIVSDRFGTGSWVEVTGGTANAALGLPTTPVQGTGDVSDISAVTFAEIKAVVEADIPTLTVQQGTGGVVELVSNTTGSSSSIQVTATGVLQATLGFDTALHEGSDSGSANAIKVEGKTHGAYANAVTAVVSNASSGDATEFNLSLVKEGITEESFPNLSPDPTADRYYVTIVNDDTTGSVLVQLEDLGLGGNPRPSNQSVTLTGGDDGLTGLADTDFLGSATGGTGLHAFETVSGSLNVAAPGRTSAIALTGIVDYVEIDRGGRGFPILACDEAQAAETVALFAESNLVGYSEFGAFYWPRVSIVNPDATVFGTDTYIDVPPEGHIAGMFARVDASQRGGVYVPPAGPVNGRLRGVVGVDVEDALKERKRDVVASRLVNPIRSDGGSSFYVDGVWTLRTDYNFPTVSERRGVNFIEDTIEAGMEIYRFRNNDARLRAEVDRDIRRFLTEQMFLGAFRSTDPETAFEVIVSDDPADIFANLLKVSILLATQKPTIWIELNFSQDVRALLTAQA